MRMTVPEKKRGRLDGEPKVGIFWLVGKRIVLAATPLAKAEPWGELRNIPAGHADEWASLQRDGSVPREMEYDESPRGRLIYDTRTRRFTVTADRCIIVRKNPVSIIVGKLGLPTDTTVLADDHHRCQGCKPKPSRKQEEEDWQC